MKKSEETKSRILNVAIELFGSRDYEDVAIADIAREMGVTPQGVYRYFAGKQELYELALCEDINNLQHKVILAMKDQHLPTITGFRWRIYSQEVHNHPLARKIIPLRDQRLLAMMGELKTTREIFRLGEEEAVAAQKFGLLRQDVDFRLMYQTLEYFAIHVLFPLVYEGKYGTPEWFNAAQILVAYSFYPIPDLSTPEKLTEFELRIKETIQKMIAASTD